MKLIKYTLIKVLAIALLTGCGSDDPKPSAKKQLQDALTTASWVIDPASSDISGVTGSPNISSVTITFSSTDAGASFTFGGDIQAYVSAGIFNISDDGVAWNPILTVDPTIEVTDIQLNEVSATNFKITFNTAIATGRMDGVGSFELTFNAN